MSTYRIDKEGYPTYRVKIEVEIANAPDGVDQDEINKKLQSFLTTYDDGRYNYMAEVVSEQLNNMFDWLVYKSVKDTTYKKLCDERFIKNSHQHIFCTKEQWEYQQGGLSGVDS